MAKSEMIVINSPQTVYTDSEINATYNYQSVQVKTCQTSGRTCAEPLEKKIKIKTQRNVPRTGLMLIGLGGNNGSTVVAGILSNKKKLQWETRDGTKKANWYGSMVLCSTMKLGVDAESSEEVYVPLNSVIPMTHPDSWTVGGWDISKMPLGDAMKRAKVLDYSLQMKLYDEMQMITPLPAIFSGSFVAANQSERADNVLQGSNAEKVEKIREDIRAFKRQHKLENVIVVWTANTERYAEVVGFNSTAEQLLEAIKRDEAELSPSTMYCVASILEGCSYINGSPQNTFVPGVVDLAIKHGVFIGGNDFKSGQTKMKSVLVDFLISAGIKPASITSYNHLGNNDGKNLSAPEQFRSKELSKSNVIDDMVLSNNILYSEGESPDHCVVIKYIPAVGDSKRALDEYTSEIFLGGSSVISTYNVCEDSLLAVPLIIDLVIMTELFQRISVQADCTPGQNAPYEKLHSVLSMLSYFCKAPEMPPGTAAKNALFAQRECILNMLRACVGLPPESHLMLEHKVNWLT